MSTPLAPPELCITTLRTLAIDAIEAANSGHPGAPMGLAPVGWRLFSTVLRHSPANPTWPDRDRFVLSAGHASMLIYGLLHLTGYDLPLDEIKRFRQWDSITPGHPEYGLTPGIETTTGPLGQGFGNAVGFALAEEMLAARFNRPGHAIVDHRTWFICSDGDLMEGISHEAASFAGHQKLGKLIGIYDDNDISLDGPTSLSVSEDTAARFAAYGWRVLRITDGNDLEQIDAAFAEAMVSDGRPTLIICTTHIGYGAPTKQDSSKSHGAALGAEEAAATKRFYGWPEDPPFLVPAEVDAWKAKLTERGRSLEADWDARFAAYREAHANLAAQFLAAMDGGLPTGWDADIPVFGPDDKLATRASGGKVINAIAGRVPELVQGAADLSESTATTLKDMGTVTAGDKSGRNIYYGVREHAMGAITNALALHGGLRPVCATFLQFYDYMKNTVRLAALMEIPSIFVYTHDSIALGEDGPTHQPVEHIAALRAVPNCVTLRPADAAEVAGSWRVAMEREDGPTVLVLSRQALPALGGSADVARGAYVVADGTDCVLIGTGSEVSVAVGAREILATHDVSARVVSMPSWELFEQQDADYMESVLPDGPPRIAIEAAATHGWGRWADAVMGIDTFGASAPGPELMEQFGLTPEALAEAALDILGHECTH
jgi:transketolase